MALPGLVCGWIACVLPIGGCSRVRLQTQTRYNGILDCILKTFPVGVVAISNSLMFGSYSNALNYLSGRTLKDWKNPPSTIYIMMAGGFAGAVQVIFTAPVDLIKVRLQNQTEAYKLGMNRPYAKTLYRGPFHCTACIFREEGFAGLYRGLVALSWRDMPTIGLYFLTYELLCKWMTNSGEVPGIWTTLFAGGCAGTVGWAAANPMDVIKSRLQMDGMQGTKYRGVLDCMVKSIQREGAKVLLKGLTINSLRAFPVNAVTFLSYEVLLRTLR
uniref:Solute carrier family 25 member 45 n=1 Tax=Leptobrachium leishanense TaxID=445787 RepID=A0A8C5PIB3_9ANUR